MRMTRALQGVDVYEMMEGGAEEDSAEEGDEGDKDDKLVRDDGRSGADNTWSDYLPTSSPEKWFDLPTDKAP